MKIGNLHPKVLTALRRWPGSDSSGWLLVALFLLSFAYPLPLCGQTPSVGPGEIINPEHDPVLKSIEGLTIHDRLGHKLPVDRMVFVESGERVALSKIFESKRPVILNPVYFSCPMLCNLVVEGLIDSVAATGLKIGVDFDVVTLSIDPRDTPIDARTRENLLIEALEEAALLSGADVSGARDGWSFITGQESDLKAIADSVGFEYRWNDFNNEYVHGAGVFIISPEGVLTQTIKGINYEPQTLRLALVEASDGKVGNWLDEFVLTCFVYDPTKAQYGPAALKVMRLGGGLFVLGLGGFLLRMWGRGPRGRQPVIMTDLQREQSQS
ncbi:MAG: SCO family protein [Planctomycetota bacterium]